MDIDSFAAQTISLDCFSTPGVAKIRVNTPKAIKRKNKRNKGFG
jgi:hypothetical protein